MIKEVNRREMALHYTIAPGTVVLAPTVSAVLAPKWVCPVPGRVKALVLTVIVAAVAGDSTDLKDTVHVDKRGITGAVGAVAVTDKVSLCDCNLTPDYYPAAGTRLLSLGKSGNHCVRGEVLEPYWTETGTKGTTARPTFSIAALIFEPDVHNDPTQ